MMFHSEAKSIDLPETATTRDGQEYSPGDMIWRFVNMKASLIINFKQLEEFFDAQFIIIVKKVGIDVLRRSDIGTLRAQIDFLFTCGQVNNDRASGLIGQLTEAHLAFYLKKCRTTAHMSEHQVATLRIYLKRWLKLKLPGLAPNVKPYLEKIKLKNNPRGVAVRMNDPEKGAFSDEERMLIDKALSDGFANNEISLEVYLLVILFTLYAQRPIQYACLKIKDLIIKHASDGTPSYLLYIPRVKNGKLYRAEFLPPKSLPVELGEIIEAQIHIVKIMANNFEGNTLATEELPLFPAWLRKRYPPGFLYHNSAKGLSAKIKKAMRKLKIVSTTTKKLLNIFPYRFRHTMGTQCIAEGKSLRETADILGQKTTQSSECYVEFSKKFVKRISPAYAIAIAPFKQAFRGKLISHPSEAKLQGDPESAVRSREINDSSDLGFCGEYDFCGGKIPYACYTCQDFEPLACGPHEEFLRHLIEEREKSLDKDKYDKIATVNDLTIYACAEVVKKCSEYWRKENGRD